MFPKWKLRIIIWKLCQVPSPEIKPFPHSDKTVIIWIVDRGLTHQSYNVGLVLVGDRGLAA